MFKKIINDFSSSIFDTLIREYQNLENEKREIENSISLLMNKSIIEDFHYVPSNKEHNKKIINLMYSILQNDYIIILKNYNYNFKKLKLKKYFYTKKIKNFVIVSEDTITKEDIYQYLEKKRYLLI